MHYDGTKKVKTGSSSSKSVLTWLADMCGADLCAYPSVSALAEVTELEQKELCRTAYDT